MTYYHQTETLNVNYESLASSSTKLEFELAEDVKTYFVPGKLYKTKKPMNYNAGNIISGSFYGNHPWYGTTTLAYTALSATISSQTTTLGQTAMYGASTTGIGAMLPSTQTSTTVGAGGLSAATHSTGNGVGSNITITGGTGGAIGGGLTISGGYGASTGVGGAVTITRGYGGSYGGYQTPEGSIIMLLDIKQLSEERTQIKYLSKLKTYTLDFWPGQSSLASNFWPPEPQDLFEYLERCE